MSAYALDARYLLCPMPVIRTQNRVGELKAGDTLAVTCTDPGALHDIPAWCRVHGHQMVSATEKDGEILVVLRVGA